MLEDPQPPRSRLLGVWFKDVPPVESSYLPLDGGLTVLYGPNGAGKSRLLDSLIATLNGEASGAWILLEFPAPRDGQVSALQALVSDVLLGARYRDLLASADWRDQEGAIEAWIHRTLEDNHRGDRDPVAGRQLPADRVERIVTAMMSQRRILLRGAGYGGNRVWDAAPCLMADAAYPDLADEIHRLVAGEAYLSRLEEASMADPGADDPSETVDAFYDSGLFELIAIEGLEDPIGTWTDRYLSVPWERFALDFDTGLESTRLAGEDTAAALSRHLQSVLRASREALDEWLDREDNSPEPEQLDEAAILAEAVEFLQEVARRSFAEALLDAPELTLELGDPPRWLEGSRPLWIANDMPLDRLSRAEQRWARWAIDAAERQLALRGSVEEYPRLVIFDEPEASLHRSAERHLARMLTRHALDPFVTVVVATHSPHLLDDPTASVMEVGADRTLRGRTSRRPHVLRPLGPADRGALRRLGLEPSDLLARYRVLLLVEGAHDEAVLRAFIGSELDAARAHILRLDGGKRLPHAIDSQVVFDFTDAHIVAILDNVRVDAVSDAWDRAVDQATAGNQNKAYATLTGALGSEGEQSWIADWLKAAISAGCADRVTPWGLAARDIIEYLPVEEFVPDSTWEQLHAEHQRAKTANPKTPNFKRWLKERHRAIVGTERIREVAATLSIVPPEFRTLATLVRSLPRNGS